MKVEIQSEQEEFDVYADNMPIGAFGIIANNGWSKGQIILRGYEMLISLTDPQNTWSATQLGNLKIKLLPPGTVLTLTSEV
jgi:hypothetical protein